MTRKLLVGMSIVLVAQTAALAQQPQGTRNGAVIGGVSGAVIGGIIGKQNDEIPEGALIGGAVGAVAGGLLGHGYDQRQRAYQQPQYPQPQYAQPHHHRPNYNTYRTVPTRTTVVTPGVTVADILAMTRSGVSESVMINHIYTKGLQRRVDTNEIISLSQQGVPENVINAMQQAPLRNSFNGTTTINGGQQTTIMTPPGGTVIVQEQYGTPTYSAPTYLAPSNTQSYPTYYPAPTKRRGF